MGFESLLPYCTGPRQQQLVHACEKAGSFKAAMREWDGDKRNAKKVLAAIKARAALQGHAPEHDMTHTAPASHIVKGVSTLYGEDGEVKQQWVKTDVKQSAQFEAIRSAIDELAEEYRGIAKPVKAPARALEDLLTVYPLGDPHIGMYAWAEECGEDFDTTIARSDLLAATSRLVEVAPSSERCLIIDLGDYLHADSVANTTTRGTAQDVDTRWPKVLKVGCFCMIDLIGLALKKHQFVDVIMVPGNHNEHSSVMVNAFAQAFFHREPRVRVHDTIGAYYYYEFGKNLIGTTHGDKIKLTQLDSLMACDKPEEWGRTEHRYWYTGHIHHTSKQELRGCVVESFRTLAAKDSWHTAQGYRSGRDMYAIVLDREYGEVERYRCDIRMARRANGAKHTARS